ncbi:MAG: hypothetical protein V3T72_14740 [Thermoanaerobaculia bacterium]
MMRIIRFAVVALVLYVIVNEASPWIKSKMGSGSPAGAGADAGPTRCVYLADEANNRFGSRVGRVSGPGADPGVWQGFLGEVRGRIGDAQAECHCAAAACRKALQAMTNLEDVLNEFDVRFRGGIMERNAVGRQMEINELLNEARALAREGK